MIPSMSRKGDCYDNAVAESFFHSLKNEEVGDQAYADPGSGPAGGNRLRRDVL